MTEEEKTEKRRKKREARMQRHVVACPHCGKDVLDHMTKCPHCGGELTPRGYRPPDEAKMNKIRGILFAVGLAVAAVVIVVLVIVRN